MDEKEAFRENIKEIREGDWIRDALRARKFTGIESLEQGIDLIKCAIELHERGNHEFK
ncbi:MAG: hypothetical protein U9O96_06915 [Candidatus Thermoplasmatota archaeon]|nr:hypothetical protein [Candidatus Thermoplasmatota archaeon]